MSDSTRHHDVVALQRLQKFALEHKLLDKPVFGQAGKAACRPAGPRADAGRDGSDSGAGIPGIPADLLRPPPVRRPTGELCRATIADVDRANRVITLKEHKTARKTGQPRRIPIGRKLGELLDQAIGTRTEGPVFLSPAGKAWTRPESQPDVFPAAGSGRSVAGSGAVPGPPRVRDEDLPGEGNRVRPPIAGALEHLDDAAVHAPRRPGVGGRPGSGRLTLRVSPTHSDSRD